MQAVILAGGLGTRLRPLTEKMPKSMIPINGRPFLAYQLEFVKKNNVIDVVLCVGHLSDMIIDYFKDGRKFDVNIKYCIEKDRLLGTAGALKNAESVLSEEFFVMYGDSYLSIDLKEVLHFFKRNNKLALMTVYKNYDKYNMSNISIDGDLVKEYNKNKKSKDMVYIDYGISILNREVLEFVPAGETYSLEDLFTKLIVIQELLAFEVTQRFYEIGSMRGFEEFKQYIKSEAG